VQRSRRHELGRILDEPRLDAGEYWYHVQFGVRVVNVVECELDTVTDADESLESIGASA
jgi:hypothetical protein